MVKRWRKRGGDRGEGKGQGIEEEGKGGEEEGKARG